jgi:hypothetical protein
MKRDSAFKGICHKCGGLVSERWGECLSCGYKPAAHWSLEYAGTVAFGLIVFFIAVVFACL